MHLNWMNPNHKVDRIYQIHPCMNFPLYTFPMNYSHILVCWKILLVPVIEYDNFHGPPTRITKSYPSFYHKQRNDFYHCKFPCRSGKNIPYNTRFPVHILLPGSDASSNLILSAPPDYFERLGMNLF